MKNETEPLYVKSVDKKVKAACRELGIDISATVRKALESAVVRKLGRQEWAKKQGKRLMPSQRELDWLKPKLTKKGFRLRLDDGTRGPAQ